MTSVSAAVTDGAEAAGGFRQAASVRFSGAAACWTLYVLTLRQHLHGKRWMALALLFLLPPGLALLIRGTGSDAPSLFLEFLLGWVLVPQALLPLVALLYASGIIQDEQEEQTITYLLVRPTPKWLLYTIKMAATWTTATVLVIVLTAVTYAAVYIDSGAELSQVTARCLKAMAILSLAVVAYCSLFGLISLLTKRILIVGIIYIAVVEGLLASLPMSLRLGTVIYYARVMAYRTMGFHVTWPQQWRTETDVAAEVWSIDAAADPQLAEHPQVGTCIMVLLTAAIVFTIVAGWICSQREFHVKTPEKE
jgi:ABC-2 type transport system permease protein